MLAKINTNYAIIGWKGGIKRQKVQTCETGVTDPLLVYLTRCDTSYPPYPSVSLESHVRQTGFLTCKNQFRNGFLQATQAVKIQFEID